MTQKNTTSPPSQPLTPFWALILLLVYVYSSIRDTPTEREREGGKRNEVCNYHFIIVTTDTPRYKSTSERESG